MKILHISPSYFPAFKYGGPIQFVHLLNKTLVNKGILVDVITTNAGLKINQKKIRGNIWNEIDGIRVKYLNFTGYEHYNFSISLFMEIKKIINNYDLVHITALWNFPVLAGSVLSQKNKKPYIISVNGALNKEAIEVKSSIMKKTYWNLIAKKNLNGACAVHFATKNEKERVLSNLQIKSKTFIVPNGIDLTEINYSKKLNLKYNKKYILFLGRISKIKGFDLLIPAFSKLIKKNDLNLVIAGPDNEGYKKEVENLIKKENLENRINFTGLVNEEKWSLYKNALMFVLPSHSENFGMSVVEAIACETPVVISDKVGIYKEVETANAGVIVKTEIDSLYNGMKQIVENEKLRKKISVNGRKLVEDKYDIEMVADQMIKVYSKVIFNF